MKKIKLHIVARSSYIANNFPDFNELLERHTVPDSFPNRFYCGGCGAWIFQTILYLNYYYNELFDFSLGDKCRPDAINFMHNDHFGSRVRPWVGPTVVVRADRPPVVGADYVVEQNPQVAKLPGHTFMPLWPQPGLIPRGRNDNTVKTVAYFGLLDSLPEEYVEDNFAEQLAAQGITLKICVDNWTDYSDVDVCISFRKKHNYKLARKPPSKLINSWLGNTVMICDDEPSFRAIRESELDYLIAKCPEDTFYAIMKLKNSPELFSKMREQGKKRIQDYPKEAIAARWFEFFENIWDKGIGDRSTVLSRFLRFGFGKAIHPLTRRF